jgi:hypothetical protein
VFRLWLPAAASAAALTVALTLALAVAGCANHSPEAEAQAEAAAVARDGAKCQAAGLTPNTPPFEKCLMQLADQRAASDNVDRTALMNRLQSRPPAWAQ